MSGEPKFNIGDEITINFISGTESFDYPCGFVNGMMEYHGKKFKIESIDKLRTNQSNRKLSFLWDGYEYKLKGISWNWTTSMFAESQNEL